MICQSPLREGAGPLLEHMAIRTSKHAPATAVSPQNPDAQPILTVLPERCLVLYCRKYPWLTPKVVNAGFTDRWAIENQVFVLNFPHTDFQVAIFSIPEINFRYGCACAFMCWSHDHVALVDSVFLMFSAKFYVILAKRSSRMSWKRLQWYEEMF